MVYFTIKAAPYINDGGPMALLDGLYSEIDRPFHFVIGWWTIKAVVGMTLFYLLTVAVIYSSLKNYRHGEEHGSAKWASVYRLNKKYAAKEDIFKDIPMWRQNMILTHSARMGYDFYRPQHQKNANILIIGGPGTMKSRGYIGPNIMQMNSSMVITDPKGELAKKFGNMLKDNGYRVVVFDISKPEKSACYNPFKYFRNDKDVLQFVNNFFAATEDKNAQKGEKYWDDQAKNLMLAFAYLLYHEAPAEEQNFGMINELLLAANVMDNNDDNISAVDVIFMRLEEREPEHPAVRYYKSYHKGSGKTLQSIQSTLSSKLSHFNLESIVKLTNTDDIDICRIATEKTVVFCVTPDSDASLNFLVGTLYQQMFQQLYDLADNVYDGPLPIHIRFLMDEFANIALPDDYSKILSTARSRNMSFAIVLQDKSQIEKLYETLYKTIMACCSTWLFLGSNEKETCEYISSLVGKETITAKEYSKSQGRWTVNYRQQERWLITPDEVRRKANEIAILIIEGEDALKDKKYDMKNHKYYKYVAEGKNLKRKKDPAVIFDWGSIAHSNGNITQLNSYQGKLSNIDSLQIKSGKVLSDEEIIRKYAT